MTKKEQLEHKAKESVFLKICDLYSEGEPLKESLDKFNIKPRMFGSWIRENPDWKKIFDEASDAFILFQEQNIRSKALKSFEKLVMGYTVVEESEESRNGKVTKTGKKEKHFAPNAQAVILALQKLIPNVYSDPAKLLPPPPEEEEEQVFKIGDREIKFK